MRIDHVILAAQDLDAAAARVESAYGLPVAGGGRHDGLGTHNRIVPLGRGYLELLAVADRVEAEGSPLGRGVLQRLERAGDGPMGWAVSVDDVAPVAQRLGVEVSTISRQGLSAHLAGVAEAMAEPCLPFFIARDHGIPDPGGAARDGGLEWVEVSGDARRVEEWLGPDHGLPVRVVDGPPGLRAAGVVHGGREITIGRGVQPAAPGV